MVAVTPLYTPAYPWYNRWLPRLGDHPGGPVPTHPRAAPAPGQVDDLERAPDSTMEHTLQRERMPWVKRPSMVPPGRGGYLDWTGQGNIRPSLLMRDTTVNRRQGSSQTRALDPIPVGLGTQLGTGEVVRRQLVNVPSNSQPHGYHTRYPAGGSNTAVLRSRATPQMRPRRQGRLTANPYTGQSYSQTTQVQGG